MTSNCWVFQLAALALPRMLVAGVQYLTTFFAGKRFWFVRIATLADVFVVLLSSMSPAEVAKRRAVSCSTSSPATL